MLSTRSVDLEMDTRLYKSTIFNQPFFKSQTIAKKITLFLFEEWRIKKYIYFYTSKRRYLTIYRDNLRLRCKNVKEISADMLATRLRINQFPKSRFIRILRGRWCRYCANTSLKIYDDNFISCTYRT